MKHSSYILLNLNGKHWTCSTPSTCWIRFGSVLQFVLAHCWTLICQCGARWNLRPSSSRYSYRGQLYLGILGTFVPLKALNHCCHLNHWNDCFHSVWVLSLARAPWAWLGLHEPESLEHKWPLGSQAPVCKSLMLGIARAGKNQAKLFADLGLQHIYLTNWFT